LPLHLEAKKKDHNLDVHCLLEKGEPHDYPDLFLERKNST
jgi:hypothetical protein